MGRTYTFKQVGSRIEMSAPELADNETAFHRLMDYGIAEEEVADVEEVMLQAAENTAETGSNGEEAGYKTDAYDKCEDYLLREMAVADHVAVNLSSILENQKDQGNQILEHFPVTPGEDDIREFRMRYGPAESQRLLSAVNDLYALNETDTARINTLNDIEKQVDPYHEVFSEEY